MEIPTKVVRYFIGMTRSDDASNSNLLHTERYRAAQGKNDYTYFAHDLAVGTADKFQFISLLRNTNMQETEKEPAARLGRR